MMAAETQRSRSAAEWHRIAEEADVEVEAEEEGEGKEEEEDDDDDDDGEDEEHHQNERERESASARRSEKKRRKKNTQTHKKETRPIFVLCLLVFVFGRHQKELEIYCAHSNDYGIFLRSLATCFWWKWPGGNYMVLIINSRLFLLDQWFPVADACSLSRWDVLVWSVWNISQFSSCYRLIILSRARSFVRSIA